MTFQSTSGWTRVELATGIPLGIERSALSLPHCNRTPRREFERIVRSAFETGRQVFVCFSGGRDSSAVLAIAVHVSRELGAPPPIPVTLRFPDHPLTYERSWQELVVRHLGLSDWVVLERDGADVLAPDITSLLGQWGLFYPPQIGSYVPVLDVAAGGAVLSGEGGDESFGGWRFRAALHPSEWGLRAALRSCGVVGLAHGPTVTRRWYVQRTRPYVWLTPAGKRAAIDEMSQRAEVEPVRWSRYLQWVFARRAWRFARATLDRTAALTDCLLIHPLAEPSLVSAISRAWSSRGPIDRTDVMRTVVGDLLPDAIIERDDKAALASLFIGQTSRAFIEAWDGSGLDAEFVDVEALRRVWQRENPYVGALTLLHQAWLASEK